MSSTTIHIAKTATESFIRVYDLKDVQGPILECKEDRFGSWVTVFLNAEGPNSLEDLKEAIATYEGGLIMRDALKEVTHV